MRCTYKTKTCSQFCSVITMHVSWWAGLISWLTLLKWNKILLVTIQTFYTSHWTLKLMHPWYLFTTNKTKTHSLIKVGHGKWASKKQAEISPSMLQSIDLTTTLQEQCYQMYCLKQYSIERTDIYMSENKSTEDNN